MKTFILFMFIFVSCARFSDHQERKLSSDELTTTPKKNFNYFMIVKSLLLDSRDLLDLIFLIENDLYHERYDNYSFYKKSSLHYIDQSLNRLESIATYKRETQKGIINWYKLRKINKIKNYFTWANNKIKEREIEFADSDDFEYLLKHLRSLEGRLLSWWLWSLDKEDRWEIKQEIAMKYEEIQKKIDERGDSWSIYGLLISLSRALRLHKTKTEYENTKRMLYIYEKSLSGEATKEEEEFANKQFINIIKNSIKTPLAIGLFILPGGALLISAAVALGKRYGIDILPNVIESP